MKIGIIDADLIGRQKHRFPNLACEKISGFWKEQGADVSLLLSYDYIGDYDQVFISKVFTDTEVPQWLHENDSVHLGGTGFYFAHAPNLPDEIEHHMPDYHLYDEWIASEVERAKDVKGEEFNEERFMTQFKEYTDYSIGFLTRGCFRKCKFCVNQKYDHVFQHSPLEEFYDPTRKKICLLDDNFLGCPSWRELLQVLIETKKPFKFKQGLDERLLTHEKCEILFNSRYDGDFTFAFDNIQDYNLIHEKLKMIRAHSSTTRIRFYVLCGFNGTDAADIEDTFKRIELLFNYRCLPYIMRYMNKNETPWKCSPYAGLYTSIARWCNQANLAKKMSFRAFCEANQALHKTDGTLCAPMKAMTSFEAEHPDIAKKYFDIHFGDQNPQIV